VPESITEIMYLSSLWFVVLWEKNTCMEISTKRKEKNVARSERKKEEVKGKQQIQHKGKEKRKNSM